MAGTEPIELPPTQTQFPTNADDDRRKSCTANEVAGAWIDGKGFDLSKMDKNGKLYTALKPLDLDGGGFVDCGEILTASKAYHAANLPAEGDNGAEFDIAAFPEGLHKTLKAFDVDGDGSISAAELGVAATLYEESKKQVKQMMKIVAGLLFLMLCMLGAICGLSIAVAEGTKETKTTSSGIGLVAGTDTPAGTAVSTEGAGLGSMLTMNLRDAATLKDAKLTLPATDCLGGTAGMGGDFIYRVTYVGRETDGTMSVGLEGDGLLRILTSTAGTLKRPCSQFTSGVCIVCPGNTAEELPVTFDATESRRFHALGRRYDHSARHSQPLFGFHGMGTQGNFVMTSTTF